MPATHPFPGGAALEASPDLEVTLSLPLFSPPAWEWGFWGRAGLGGQGGAHSPVCIRKKAASLRPVPPELIGDSDALTNVTAALHSPLTLLCEATGTPPPEVRWFRGEEPLSPREDTYLLAGKVATGGVSGGRVWPPTCASDPEQPAWVG